MSNTTRNTATKEDGKSTLVPKLRFPEFRDAEGWQQKLIGSYLKDCSGRVPSNTELPVYSSTREGLKRQDDYFDGRVLQNKNEYGVVPLGCLVYRHMSDDGLFKFNINETGSEIAVSKEYPVFSTRGLDSVFLLAMLNEGPNFKQFALSQKAGGTRTRLYFSRLCEWKTLLPSLPEQQKIAECISSVDELMAAQARKLDALKTHKKGLMQQLFPCEGEPQPRLRFPEFQNAGEWEVKPFAKLFSIGNGRDHKHLVSGDIPVYGSGGFMRSVDEYLYDGESVCIGRKGTINNPMFLTGKFWTVDTLFYTHSFNKCLPKFIFSIFQNINWLKHNEAGGVPSLSKTNIEKIEAAIPSIPEQQRIADCLTSLDDLITAEAQKLDAIKTHKKGLMQQLFPSPDEQDTP